MENKKILGPFIPGTHCFTIFKSRNSWYVEIYIASGIETVLKDKFNLIRIQDKTKKIVEIARQQYIINSTNRYEIISKAIIDSFIFSFELIS